MPTAEPVAALDLRFSDPDASATAWDAVRHTIEAAELFWISTVRADGRPHVTPLSAVWQDGALYFCTDADEQKGVNSKSNANCVLTTGNKEWKSGLDVIVGGRAHRVSDDELLRRLASTWEAKYHGDWTFDVPDGIPPRRRRSICVRGHA